MKKNFRRDSRPRSAARPTGNGDRLWLYGLHAVEAALRNPGREKLKLLATPNAALKLARAIDEAGLTPEDTTPRNLDRMLGPDSVHQGIALETEPLPEPEYASLADAELVVVLDQVTDPHNVGAILRSAAVFGAGGLIMTARHSPPLDAVLAKAASGGLEVVPVHLVRNLGEALIELREMGMMRLGLDGAAGTTLGDARLKGPVALVLGAEGRGLRERTRSLCDMLARIETASAFGSLNVSNAAAVAMHALSAPK